MPQTQGKMHTKTPGIHTYNFIFLAYAHTQREKPSTYLHQWTSLTCSGCIVSICCQLQHVGGSLLVVVVASCGFIVAVIACCCCTVLLAPCSTPDAPTSWCEMRERAQAMGKPSNYKSATVANAFQQPGTLFVHLASMKCQPSAIAINKIVPLSCDRPPHDCPPPHPSFLMLALCCIDLQAHRMPQVGRCSPPILPPPFLLLLSIAHG